MVNKGILKYMIAWVPTLEPEENVSLKLKEVWKAKKAAMLAPREDSKCGSGTKKQRVRARGRAKVERQDQMGEEKAGQGLGRAGTRLRED